MKEASNMQKTLIRRARELIQDPACWTQTTLARDHLSQSVSPRSGAASAFCVFGALTRAAHEHGISDTWLAELFDASLLSQLIHANDGQDHAAVLALLEHLESGIAQQK
jgi:hypothetical protein